jgi:hypothetical protein
MSTTLTNAIYINIFDEKLKSYNNIFFKTLQDYDLLNETTDIKGSKALNIGGENTYRTDQFNEFIRNIINFDIKNYSDLSATGTNLEFVNRSVNGSTATYSFNNDVRDNIIDTLKILNVFVDILEAYKHCIDKDDIATINTGYFDEIDIEKIEIVSSGTRFYTAATPAAVPDINTYKNVGYIRNTKTSANATPKNVLYLSIQSFYTGLTTANYNTIFDKKVIDGTYSVSDNCDKITTQIFDPSDSAMTPLNGLVLAKKDYAMHFYDKTITINKSGLTREGRNKNVVSLLLKCLFNIDPKYRKQSVYGLYYYYKFVQLYATLIINVSNVMYADVNYTANYPKRIDIYNTGATNSVTAIEVVTEGIGYVVDNGSNNTLDITGGGGNNAAARAIADADGNIIKGNSSKILITDYGTGYTSAPNVVSDDANPPIKKRNALDETHNGSVAKLFKTANDNFITAGSNYDAAREAETQDTSKNTLTQLQYSSLQSSIDTQITGIDIDIDINGNYIANGEVAAKTDAAIITAAKAVPNVAIITTTYDIYIQKLINKRKRLLIKNERERLKDVALAAKNQITYREDQTALYKATIVPLAFENITTTQGANIDRLKDVINDIENKITSLITEIKSSSIDVDDEELVILTNNVDAKINKSSNNNVVIMIASTSSTAINKENNPIIYRLLKKYNDNSSFTKDYSIYDKKNKIYYNIESINDTTTDGGVIYFAIEINAVFTLDPTKPTYKPFYKYDGTEYGAYASATSTIFTAAGDFLQIKKKDINGFKNNYVNNKKAIDELNANISLNTNRVNNQKNLYETQYNKNVFLSRQILTYNILICTIIVVLIGINVFKIDKPLVKSISLACLGIIILLFIIYFMSNITYIETFAVDANSITTLKDTSVALPTRNTNKVSALNTEIDKLNAQFIRYFETITILLPTSDSVDFYKEITSVINADIENKTYLDKILDFNSSQGNTNMDTLKYELENNKLYILTLLISSIIFIGLYNIYINYINDDKYLSLMIFIAIIIFIVIGAYYIINSNRRVRTIHKNIYWGPQSSESF